MRRRRRKRELEDRYLLPKLLMEAWIEAAAKYTRLRSGASEAACRKARTEYYRYLRAIAPHIYGENTHDD